MNKPYDDSNWREEYKEMKLLSKRQLELLDKGPDSLSASWLVGAMYQDWKKKKGYNKLDPKDNEGQYQSSLKEWEQSIKKYEDMPPEAFGPGSPLSNQAGDGMVYDDYTDPYGGH